MWGPTGADAPARPKDLPALKAALDETGMHLTAQVAEPRTQFMIPPREHSEFYRRLDEGVAIATELGCARIVVGSGAGFGGSKRATQLDDLIEIYRKAIAQVDGSGVTLVLEAVNVRVDHPGSLLDRTAEAAYVARGVDSPFFGILYDLYHSSVEGEDIATELEAAGALVKYVQVADAPGRGEPGSGAIDWPEALQVLRRSGYEGPIGLEYHPTTESATSAEYIRKLVHTV
jgi:hydroxypyruvate isomerase